MTELLLTNGIPPRQFHACIELARLCDRRLIEEGRKDILRRSKAGRGRG